MLKLVISRNQRLYVYFCAKKKSNLAEEVEVYYCVHTHDDPDHLGGNRFARINPFVTPLPLREDDLRFVTCDHRCFWFSSRLYTRVHML